MSIRSRAAGRLACAVLVAVAAAAHVVAVWGLAALWIAPDEPTYGMLGRSLWHSGRLALLGVEGPFYGIVYPALAGLPLTAFGTADGIRALQILQPLVMSLTGVVVYAWACRLVAPRWALLAGALALAIPAFVYSGLLMTEVAFYPIATVALLAMARALETPSLERQAVAVTAILLASLTRLQALALLPVLITAIVVAAVFERSPRLLRRFAVTLGAPLARRCPRRRLQRGWSVPRHARRIHHDRAELLPSGAAARWVLWHAGDVFLIVAGAPLLATAVLAVDAFRGRERAPAARALLAVTVSYVLWSIAQVGVFASHFSGVLLERNLFTVAPPIFLVFALWLERGAPRPQPATAIACVVAVLPAVVIPPRALHRCCRSTSCLHVSRLLTHSRLDLVRLGSGDLDHRRPGDRSALRRAAAACGLAAARAHALVPDRELGGCRRRRPPSGT